MWEWALYVWYENKKRTKETAMSSETVEGRASLELIAETYCIFFCEVSRVSGQEDKSAGCRAQAHSANTQSKQGCGKGFGLLSRLLSPGHSNWPCGIYDRQVLPSLSLHIAGAIRAHRPPTLPRETPSL